MIRMHTAKYTPSHPDSDGVPSVRRTVHVPSPPTRGSCSAAMHFGLILDDLAPPTSHPVIQFSTPPQSLTVITGPSGSGKTTLLRDIDRAMREACWKTVHPRRLRLPSRPAVDLFRATLPDALAHLARIGLADAHAVLKRPSELSAGQHSRLRIALALHRASQLASPRQPVALIIDEFGAGLDSPTARQLARLLARTIRRSRCIRAVIATPREDLARALQPHQLIRVAEGRALVEQLGDSPLDDLPLTITQGTMEEYSALAHLHYRAGPPATIERTLAAHCAEVDTPIGVLIVSMPSLNASWRAHAWPGRFDSRDPRINARQINTELRCISRVIVDPRFRGLGVARRLVRAYLDDPITPFTEAVAAMGRVCPFFERAGMTPYDLPRAAHHLRLLDALAHAGVEPWRLAMPHAALTRAEATTGPRFIERELQRWARDSRATRSLTEAEPLAIITRAARTIGAEPMAYAHTAQSRSASGP